MPEDHHTFVSAWLDRRGALPPAELLRLFNAAIGALWRRAQIPLGEVTLMAITDRVLHDAARRFPILAPLATDAAGVRCDGIDLGSGPNPDELREGLLFVLAEFLTVLGNLTAEVLTPALHAELSQVLIESEKVGP